MKASHPHSAGISRNTFLRALVLGLPLAPLGTLKAQAPNATDPPSEPDLGNLRAFVALARSDIRAEKALIIAENMVFTEEEAVEFWPAHRDYELELDKLLDQRYALLVKFTKQFATMTDADATTLAKQVFDLEEKRTALKRKYFKKLSKVVPALKAARFFQLENQINLALDLKLAASLPLIK